MFFYPIEVMLCHHEVRPNQEYTGKVHPLDLDLRQEAATDFFRWVVKKEGKTRDVREEFPHVVAKNGAMATKIYGDAKKDAWRKLHGRTGARKKRASPSVEELQATLRGPQLDRLHELIGQCSCNWQEEENCFTWIEDAGELKDRYLAAAPRVREAICTMIHVFELLQQDKPIPSHVYQKLSRMRKDTGLPLDVNALRGTIL